MKICPKCGNQLIDEALFCEYCGAPQQVMSQPMQPQAVQPMQQMAQQQMMPEQGISQELPSGKKSKKKKGSKKPLIITIIIVLVAALGVCAFFLLKNVLKSPQEKLLDEYFEAINNKDLDTVYDMEYGLNEGLNASNYVSFYIQNLGFTPGLFSSVDSLVFDQEIVDAYYKSLGYEGKTHEELIENRREDFMGDADILLSGFKASYELEDLKKAEDCELGYYKNGLTYVEVDDIEKFIEDKYGIDVSDVYVAKMKIYWEYNGLKYGNDEKLMDILKKKDIDLGYDIYDMNDELDDMDYYMVIYKCGEM